MFQRHFHHLLTCCMLFLLHSHRRSHKCVRSSRICLCTWSNSSIHWKHEIRQPFNSVGKSYTFCVTDLSKTRLEESEKGKQKKTSIFYDEISCPADDWISEHIHILSYTYMIICVYFSYVWFEDCESCILGKIRRKEGRIKVLWRLIQVTLQEKK